MAPVRADGVRLASPCTDTCSPQASVTAVPRTGLAVLNQISAPDGRILVPSFRKHLSCLPIAVRRS